MYVLNHLKKPLLATVGVGAAYYLYNANQVSYLWQDNGNRVYSWGACMQGQLGLGEAKFSVDIPTEIEELADKNVT